MPELPPRFCVCLYEGNTVCEMRILAAGTDPDLVEIVLRRLLPERANQSKQNHARKQSSRRQEVHP